jgi:hypothetical protein
LDARGLLARWVGYDDESPHAHRVYWPEKHSITVERDVKFTTNTVTVHISPPPQLQAQIQIQATAPKVPPINTTCQPTPQAQQPETSIPEADPIPQTPDKHADDTEQVEEDDYVIPSPLTPIERQPPPQQPPKPPRKQKPTMLPRPEPPRRSARIAQLSGAKQTASEGSAEENNLRQHARRAALSRQVDDSTNESFATAPEEPSDAEMAFHIEIDMTTAAAAHDTSSDPQSISEAQSRPDWPEWQRAMEREIDTLEHAGTWETVACPENKNIVGSKWVFRLKRKANGSIDKYKAHLIARGFTQVYGVDYFDTFSPVAKMTSIRVILAIAA